jgi:hypothetical protein
MGKNTPNLVTLDERNRSIALPAKNDETYVNFFG